MASRDAVRILSRLIAAKEGYVDRDRDLPRAAGLHAPLVQVEVSLGSGLPAFSGQDDSSDSGARSDRIAAYDL